MGLTYSVRRSSTNHPLSTTSADSPPATCLPAEEVDPFVEQAQSGSSRSGPGLVRKLLSELICGAGGRCEACLQLFEGARG